MASPLVSVRTAVICALGAVVCGGAGVLSLAAEASPAQAVCCAAAAFVPAVTFLHRVVAPEAGRARKRSRNCCG